MDMNYQPHNEMSWPWIKAQYSEGREWAIFTLVLVQSLSCVWLFVTPRNVAHRLPCPSLSPWVCSNACALSRYCYPTISYPCPLLLLPSVFRSIRVSSSGSALHVRLPKYWSFSFSISTFIEYSGLISLGSTGLISLPSKQLPRVFSSTTVWKNQFFSAQPSLWSNSHLCMTTGKTLTIRIFVSKMMSNLYKILGRD